KGFDQPYLTETTFSGFFGVGETSEIPGASDHFGGNWPRKQWEIFKQIYNGYEDVKEQWDAENKEKDSKKRPFQKAVAAYKVSDTINPGNSPEVDDFYSGLLGLVDADYESDPKAVKLLS